MSNPTFDYDFVTDLIIVGNSFCTEDHNSMCWDDLRKHGVFADIDLRAEAVSLPGGMHAHLWLPVLDTYAPTLEQAKVGVDFIEDIVLGNKKVYVHCQHGHGRAPTLAACYFILKKNMSVPDAIALLKEKRAGTTFSSYQQEFLESLIGENTIDKEKDR